jgi:DNA-binding response OmpR family regulator
VDDDAETESRYDSHLSRTVSWSSWLDGNQGLALAERENPDLVILDMMMKLAGFWF